MKTMRLFVCRWFLGTPCFFILPSRGLGLARAGAFVVCFNCHTGYRLHHRPGAHVLHWGICPLQLDGACLESVRGNARKFSHDMLWNDSQHADQRRVSSDICVFRLETLEARSDAQLLGRIRGIMHGQVRDCAHTAGNNDSVRCACGADCSMSLCTSCSCFINANVLLFMWCR